MNFNEFRLTCLAFFADFLLQLLAILSLFAIIVLFLLLFTPFYWITLIYGLYFFLTRDAYKKHPRKRKWYVNNRLWKYLKYYHPMALHKVSEKPFDPKKNYLFLSHPHGFFCKGITALMALNIFDWDAHFPGLQPIICNLKILFYIPLFREHLFLTGNADVGEKNLMRYLTDPNGGYAIGIIPGGTQEMMHTYPNSYDLAIKNRKGFVRVALQSGASMVPMISFGENDLYYTYQSKKGSFLRLFDELIKTMTGIGFKPLMGQGIFLPFGTFALRKPLNIVVGEPIDVVKTENPTDEEIHEMHTFYKSKLVELFESEKHKYIKNAKNVHINFVD